MTALTQRLAGDRAAQIILGLSALFGLAYLFHDFGLAAPYPGNVVIKAAGIILLAGFALQQKHPVLALGLFLGSLGDIFLALEPTQLAAGIGAFGLGHLVYIYLFARIRLTHGGRAGWSRIAALALAAYGVVILSWLQPYFGELQIPASIYNGIIMVMAVLALIGRASPIAVAGALLFVLSDSVLAVRLFAEQWPWAGWVVWISYYLGQAGIAIGLTEPLPGKA
ncbi:MAG: hypothetical protein CMF75_00190 [Maricaulis sp.]|nr:hypothetical protein [Maricaulis sp.]